MATVLPEEVIEGVIVLEATERAMVKKEVTGVTEEVTGEEGGMISDWLIGHYLSFFIDCY